MAELSLGKIRMGMCITHRNEPFLVVSAKHVKMGRGAASVKTKLKSLVSGNTIEETFKAGDTIAEADLSRTKAQFLYADGDDYYFMDEASFEQFPLPKSQVGEITNFVKQGQTVEVLNFKEKPVSISLQPKVDLKVTESPPGIRGDTAQGSVTKLVTVETGYKLNAPIFIKQGDTIKINTETGGYVERV